MSGYEDLAKQSMRAFAAPPSRPKRPSRKRKSIAPKMPAAKGGPRGEAAADVAAPATGEGFGVEYFLGQAEVGPAGGRGRQTPVANQGLARCSSRQAERVWPSLARTEPRRGGCRP